MNKVYSGPVNFTILSNANKNNTYYVLSKEDCEIEFSNLLTEINEFKKDGKNSAFWVEADDPDNGLIGNIFVKQYMENNKVVSEESCWIGYYEFGKELKTEVVNIEDIKELKKYINVPKKFGQWPLELKIGFYDLSGIEQGKQKAVKIRLSKLKEWQKEYSAGFISGTKDCSYNLGFLFGLAKNM